MLELQPLGGRATLFSQFYFSNANVTFRAETSIDTSATARGARLGHPSKGCTFTNEGGGLSTKDCWEG